MLGQIRRSIAGKLMAAGAVLAAVSFGLLGYCVIRISDLAAMEASNQHMAAALRHNGDVDMQHDSIRAAVYSALHASDAGERGDYNEAVSEFRERSEAVNQLIAKTPGLGLDPEDQQRLVDDETRMAGYVKSADALITFTGRGEYRGSKELDEFERRYDELEKSELELANYLEQRVSDGGKALDSQLLAFRRLQMLTALVLVGLSLAVMWYLRQRIVSPVTRIAAALERGSSAELAREQGFTDEVGQLARSVAQFRDATLAAQQAESERFKVEEAARFVREEAVRAAEQASRERADRERRDALVAMGQDLESRVAGIAREVSETTARLKGVAHSLAAAAENSRLETAAAASSAQQTLDGVASISEAADEMVVSITEVSNRIETVAGTGQQVRSLTSDARTRMDELGDAASQIIGITSLIASIAARTNLLALNASIEASRAGETGRGFGVVAAEVKELAQQTAHAVNDIDAQLNAIVASTRDAGEAIARVSGAIDGLVGDTNSIAGAAQQQGLATQEISRTIHQSSSGTNAMRASLAAMDEQAGETARNAHVVRDAAGELDGKAAELGREIVQFIAMTRTA